MAIRNNKHIVRLSHQERATLMKLVRGGKAAARKITQARMLLKANAGTGGPGWTDQSDAQKNELKPWCKKMWCIPPKDNTEFVCVMEVDGCCPCLSLMHGQFMESPHGIAELGH